ncbi:hypothetical protein N665_0464s0002 [Sinapis alba]|nr:hypothetical protein N665_0464s0002 [Sinapis alba]
MPFGHYNAPATFHRCMMSIFTDMIEDFMEVFMDDFSQYTVRISKHVSITYVSGIVLGHKVSAAGIKVDKAKIEIVKDFSKIARPLTALLCKEVKFDFTPECLEAFKEIKSAHVSAPIVQAPDWDLPFKIMCDASEFAVGAVLGQKKDKNSAHKEESTDNTLTSSNDYNRKALIDNAFKMDDNITIPIDINVSCNPSFSVNDSSEGSSRKDWSLKLDDALWAYQTAYKPPLGTTPFNLLYGKSCHLPIELTHKAEWAIKKTNFDAKPTAEKRLIQLNELDEISHHAYENSKLYKEITKAYHDKKIIFRHFEPNDQVLLYNSRFTLFPKKLRSRRSRPFTIKEVMPYGTIFLFNPKGEDFMVNGHSVKHYWAKAEIPYTQTMRLEMPDPD